MVVQPNLEDQLWSGSPGRARPYSPRSLNFESGVMQAASGEDSTNVGTPLSKGKRTSERRLTFLRRSMEIGDWIKRARAGNVTSTMGSPGSIHARRSILVGGSSGSQSGLLHNEQQRDNILSRQSRDQVNNGVILHNNLTFESSPSRTRRPSTADQLLQASGVLIQPEGMAAPNGLRRCSTPPTRDNPAVDIVDPPDGSASPAPGAATAATATAADAAIHDSQIHGTRSEKSVGTAFSHGAEDDDLSMSGDKEDDSCDEEDLDMSDLNSEKRANETYMSERRWLRNARKEVTAAFTKIPVLDTTAEAEEVFVDHHFSVEQQIRILSRKRRLEDCGVVFCTIDISPSRDAFIQWIYKEVENKTAVQVDHIT
ncbi:hypothetical protein R1sor_001730 [Riccia sorocarpa]|uniref:Uncharacterized protein n=1 Tax=Riccia sorocarpa TaxID=122646 RepID=A0ABD3GXL8_9MARC